MDVLRGNVNVSVLGDGLLLSKFVPEPQPELNLNYWTISNQCIFKLFEPLLSR